MKKNYLFNMKQCVLLTIAFTCLFLSSFTIAKAQQIETKPAVAWDYTIGSYADDEIVDLVVLPNNAILVAATTARFTNRETDYSIIKLTPEGKTIWDISYGGSKWEYAISIATTPNGDIIVGGSSSSDISGRRNGNKSAPNLGGYDYWIIKLDVNGNKIWDKAFGGTGNDFLTDLVVTPTEEILLVGKTVIKLDANGNKIWDKSFPRIGQSSSVGKISITPEGDCIMAGTVVNTETYEDYRILKTDSSGALLWDKVIVANDRDYLREFVVTSSGDIMLGGDSYSRAGFDKTSENKGTSRNIWVVKLDAEGNKVWDKTIGSDGAEYFGDLLVTNSGDIILGADSDGIISFDKTENSRGLYDFWVVVLDSRGEKKWDKTIGGSTYETLFSIKETPNHNLILGGRSNSNISGDKTAPYRGLFDGWILKAILQSELKTFSPMAAPVGANITIKGEGFQWFNINSVQFNGREAKFIIIDDETIIATVPYGLTPLTGTGQIKLRNATQVVKSLDIFTVIEPTPLTLQSFSPTSGSIGTPVTITGTGFLRVDTVKFKDVSTAFTIVNDSTITAVIPTVAGTMGKFKAIFNNKVVESQDRFLLSGATPLIDSFNSESRNLIKVYPNPTTGKVSVVIHEEQDSTGELTIKTMYGETVYNAILKTDEEQIIDLHQFNKRDIFIFQFIVNGSVTTQKVIVE